MRIIQDDVDVLISNRLIVYKITVDFRVVTCVLH